MNWRRTFRFSLGLFFGLNIVTAVITYLAFKLGYETSGMPAKINIAVSLAVSFLIYCALAMVQTEKPYTHAFCVWGLDQFFNTLGMYIIARELLLVPGFWLGSIFSIAALILGTTCGIRIRRVRSN